MKKRCALMGALAALCLFLAWYSTRPSLEHTARFALRHQEELARFVALAREENGDGKLRSIYCDGDDTLLSHTWNFSFEFELTSVSPELRDAWREIRSYGYFDGVQCYFENATGAIEVIFSTKGRWQPYSEGHYYIAHCLAWRDDAYSRSPLDFYWLPLPEADGMSPAQGEKGGWFYTSHKHYDG